MTPRSSNLTQTIVFERQCPYYLSIGMTYEQFWDGDAELAKVYREAEDLRTAKMNRQLWLQGLYFYQALGTALANAFASKGSVPHSYLEQPLAVTRAERKAEREKKEREKIAVQIGFMERMLKIQAEKEEKKHGTD